MCSTSSAGRYQNSNILLAICYGAGLSNNRAHSIAIKLTFQLFMRYINQKCQSYIDHILQQWRLPSVYVQETCRKTERNVATGDIPYVYYM